MENKAVVLVVDDEPSNINVVSTILSEQYAIKATNHGKKALLALDKFDIDLIMLDIHMPGMDGFEVARIIRSQSKFNHIPIIFLSSQNDENSVVKGFDVGGNDYIVKPFNPKELIARVKTHLQVHQLQKFLEMMLNLQPTITILTDGVKGQFINKTGLDFFGFDSSNDFFSRHACICNFFLQIDEYFHLHKIAKNEHWVKEIQRLSPQDQKVAIRAKSGDIKVFHVSIKSLPNAPMHIIDFTDITETSLEQRQLRQEATHDNLTGAYNRTFFDKNIDKILQGHRSGEGRKAVAFMDLDHFKRINDTFGHDRGDEVLKAFVALIKEHIRSSDVFVRWGGEEFILILSVPDQAYLQMVLEKLRDAIARYDFEKPETLTCSIGATMYGEGETIQETIKRADEALYTSKAGGRNRVTVFEMI